MPRVIPVGQVKKLISSGVFKVLYQSNIKWTVIKDQKIHLLFTSVTNPTGWDTFFGEAIGTAIQQELVLKGGYCPGLEDKFLAFSEKGPKGKTWAQLETFIKDNVRRCKASL